MKLIYSIHRFDVRLFLGVNSSSMHAHWVQVCRWISHSADGGLYVLLAVGLFGLEGIDSALLRVMALAFAVERPLFFLLKNSCKRNRPQQAIQNFQSVITPADRFSFPSGHTSAAFMVATLLAYFWPSLLVVLYLWAVAVGFSRVLLGVHFPTDTLIGAALGVSVAFFSLNEIL